MLVALREGVGDELRQCSDGLWKEAVLARLTNRLQQNLGLAEELVRWAVETWALALGVFSAEEVSAALLAGE